MPPQTSQSMTAEEIIRRCRQTYATVRSFTGRAVVTSTTAVPGIGKMELRAEACISFVRPGKLHVDGVMMSGLQQTTFLVVSDGKKSWLKTSLFPQVEETSDVSQHIATVTGIGLQAPTVLSALLLKLNWGFPFEGKPRLLGRERVQGVDCYKVRIASTVGETVVWIDTSRFLLRRMHQKFNTQELRRRMSSSSSVNPSSLPAQMETTHDFLEQKVNVPVPEKLFRKP